MDTAVKNKTEKSPNFSFLSEHSTLLSQCAAHVEGYVKMNLDDYLKKIANLTTGLSYGLSYIHKVACGVI